MLHTGLADAWKAIKTAILWSDTESGHIRICVHDRHQDTFFICLLNPEQSTPAEFGRIAGNVGFMEP